MHKGTLLRVPYHNAMHYHHALDLLLLHVPTSTLDEGTRRPGLRSDWMHKGTLLRVPYHNAMHYHYTLDLLLLHVPTSTLDEGSRQPCLRSDWMHKGTLLRVPYYTTSACLTVHYCCTCLSM